jgi:hypothetical protein
METIKINLPKHSHSMDVQLTETEIRIITDIGLAYDDSRMGGSQDGGWGKCDCRATYLAQKEKMEACTLDQRWFGGSTCFYGIGGKIPFIFSEKGIPSVPGITSVKPYGYCGGSYQAFTLTIKKPDNITTKEDLIDYLQPILDMEIES